MHGNIIHHAVTRVILVTLLEPAGNTLFLQPKMGLQISSVSRAKYIED